MSSRREIARLLLLGDKIRRKGMDTKYKKMLLKNSKEWLVEELLQETKVRQGLIRENVELRKKFLEL